MNQRLHDIAIDLLKQLIATPSFSREEDKTADLLAYFFQQQGIVSHRKGNNIWAVNQHFDSTKPSMGLATWKNSPNGKILKSDTVIAKNYLSEKEIK